MKTLGIDLAAQDKNTAACLIAWHGKRASVERIEMSCSDSHLVELGAAVDWVAIDVPFGWPVAAVEAITEYAELGRWSSDASALELRFRQTDRLVHERAKLWPLSVSSDRIAVTAWRGAKLITELSPANERVDRIGYTTGIVEAYPAAALTLWDFDRKGYKTGADADGKRKLLVAGLEARAQQAGWLSQLPAAVREACETSDHSVDALLSGLVARAAATRQTAWPDPEHAELTAVEGWIHLPLEGSFEQLGDDEASMTPPVSPDAVPFWPPPPET